MTGGWYCTSCGATTRTLPSGSVHCAHCGKLGLRGYDNERPKRLRCSDHPEWRGWDDGGVNDDLGSHERREHVPVTAADQPPLTHCPTCTCGRRAPVQASRHGGEKHGVVYTPHGEGTISWAEHEEAWADYGVRYPSQSAECIAERGGFSYGELVEHLRRLPRTWRPYR